jgi:hypothetical protein
MERRRVLALLAAVPLLALAACGDDGAATPATEPPPDETLPPTDEPGYVHPTGGDEVVLRIAYEGGFTTPDVVFLRLPTVLVTGDRVFQQGPVIEIYPGPLLPNIQVRTISEAGIQELLAAADEAGLLEQRTYDGPDNIADAPDTVVTLTVDGVTYEHRAYALGFEGPAGVEGDEDRAALQGYVELVSDYVTAQPGDVLGPESAFEPEEYLLRSFVADDLSGFEIEPTIETWPADSSVRLVDAGDCAAVPAAAFGELFTTATQLTFFEDDGVVYRLAVKPGLPGDAC